MAPWDGLIGRVDRWQRRTPPAGFVMGVTKKFGDDRGGALAAELTYYGFLSLFPSLLILATVLGFVGNREISDGVLGSTLSQFPVLGEQIGKNAAHPIEGSGVALVVGLVILLYGVVGSTQAAQHVMAQVWAIPRVDRPGFLSRVVRGLLLLVTLGVAMAGSALLSGLVTVGGAAVVARVLGIVALLVVNVALFVAAFRVLTPASIGTRALVPGAVVGAIGYTVLLTVGTALVQHQLQHAQAVYGQFGFVLGLMAWLALVAQLTVYAAELNVVLTRHLWPRGISKPPTTADDRVLRDLAHEETRREDEKIAVGFDPDPVAGAVRDAQRT
jgi:YihY family inner membrane protein